MELDEATELRNNLLQQAQGLELQRRSLLAQVARLEKKYHIEPKKGNGNGKSNGFTSDFEKTGGTDFEESNPIGLSFTRR